MPQYFVHYEQWDRTDSFTPDNKPISSFEKNHTRPQELADQIEALGATVVRMDFLGILQVDSEEDIMEELKALEHAERVTPGGALWAINLNQHGPL